MDVLTAYVQSLADAELLALATSNLVASQYRTVRAEARGRGLHGFTDPASSSPEACICGAMFVDGFHLDAVKSAHLKACAA